MQPMSLLERHCLTQRVTGVPAADEEVDPMSRQVNHAAESAVQRIADASIWLLFRLSGVRS